MNSCDMERLCSEFMFHLRDLMIVKTVKNADSILIATDDELKSLKALAENCRSKSCSMIKYYRRHILADKALV